MKVRLYLKGEELPHKNSCGELVPGRESITIPFRKGGPIDLEDVASAIELTAHQMKTVDSISIYPTTEN